MSKTGDLKMWRPGDLEVWRAGDLNIWRSGGLEIWGSGDLKSSRSEDVQMWRCLVYKFCTAEDLACSYLDGRLSRRSIIY